MSFVTSAFVAAALLTGGAPKPQLEAKGPPAAVNAMLGCRSNTDNAARLACYDRAAADLEGAVARRDVVIFSSADVRETRRSLFGFSLPKLPFLGNDDSTEAKELNTKIASSRSLGYGKWRIRLEDGAVWETSDATKVGDIPSAGDSVRIRGGVMGSYFMNIAGARAVRARRVQ